MTAAGAAALRLRPIGPRFGRRALTAAVVLAALVALYLFWVRDLPAFAVEEVRVEGVGAGPGSAEVEAALAGAARGMTTLHVREGELAAAVARFPQVESVSAEAHFPDGMTVTVLERRPAALIGTGGDAVAVADDGTIMRGLATRELDLPALPLERAPAGERLGGPVLDQALVLGAAPEALRPLIAGSSRQGDRVLVELENGIELRFGRPVLIEEKWRAATAVLADPSLTAVDYVDLTSPGRPATGGTSPLLPGVP